MTNIINNIIAQYPYPDQSLLPNIWLTWETKDGRVYLNCETNERQSEMPEWKKSEIYQGYGMSYQTIKAENICVYDGTTLKYAYCKYHESAKLLELAVVTMNSRRTYGARKWEFAKEGKRYFINLGKQIYSEEGIKLASDRFYAFQHHSTYGFANYLRMILRCNCSNHFIDEFKKLLGSDVFIGKNGRTVTAQYAWHIETWYSTVTCTKTTGKTQSLLDDLTSLPHKDLTNICREYDSKSVPMSSGNWKRQVDDVIYFESLNDTWSVLRYCYRLAGSNNDNVESYRVYISEKGDCKMAKLNNNNEWIPAQNRTASWQSSYGRIVNFDDMAKCKRLSYIMPILREFSEDKVLSQIVLIIKNPQVEKLFKMGYGDFAKKVLQDGYAKANLKNYFGDPNKKATTLFAEWGINKHQLDTFVTKINQRGDYHSNQISGYNYDQSITTLKSIFGKDLSHMDNDTFDRLIEMVGQLRNAGIYRMSDITSLNVDSKHFFNHTARLFSKSGTPSNCPRVLVDTIRMYRQITATRRPEINWIFDSYSDIIRAHDGLIAIEQEIRAEREAFYNMERAERMKLEDERRKKLDEKRKEWEYEDDHYVIRLPKDCAEILNEGTKQRICISGYASSHANGNTNLFFLRKKSEPDVPFYAIEMSNDMRVIQIHGFGNSWLGNHPDAIPTVVRWLRKNGITCPETILTCTSKGYGSNRQYVAMPVVD